MTSLAAWVREQWGRIPKLAQSSLRHALLTFVVTFIATARPLLPDLLGVHDAKTAVSLGLSALAAALSAGARAGLPYLKQALTRLLGLS